MLEFGPFCLDLGHIAWIWAILQNLGLNRPQRRRSPEGGAGGGTDGRTYGRTDGRTDSPCVLQDFVPFGAAAQKGPQRGSANKAKRHKGQRRPGEDQRAPGRAQRAQPRQKKAQKGGAPKPKGTRGKNAQGRAKGPQGEPKGPNMTTGKAGGERPPKMMGGIAINQKDPNTDIPPPLLIHTI